MEKKCNVCGSEDSIEYELIKCKDCGYVIKDLSDGLKEGWRLKITYQKDKNEIWIRGNRNGLEFLASCCLSIIGKTDPSGHIHLQEQMNNLNEGSIKARLEYSDYPEDYI